MNTGGKKFDLTIYLAKEPYLETKDLIKPKASYSVFPVNIEKDELGSLYLIKNPSNPPRWASFFSEIVSLDQIGMNQSTGALFTIKEQNRLFLICFGQGRHLIKTGCIETNFGLRTALNILEPDSIRSLDKSSLEGQPKQAREQSGEAVGLQFFGIDIESDLLRAITGKPKSDIFGMRVSGGDPLKLSLNIGLNSVRSLLNNIYDAYHDDSYKNGPFSWIDHIGEVKDKDLRDDLDHHLVEQLNARNFNQIWLCAPRIIDWERVVGFKYSYGKRAIRYHDTRIDECLSEIVKNYVDISMLQARKIIGVDDNDQIVFEDTVYHFIYAEIEFNGLVYILNSGKWYSIEANYVQRIKDQFGIIKSKKYDRHLLEYDDKTEGEYNKRLAKSNPAEYVLLDADNIYLPDAASPIEPCDIYRKEKELIHIKRYGGSSVLSHLFNQGLVSGELLQSDANFRKLFNNKLPLNMKIDGIENRPGRNEYTVVYAIISEQEDGLDIPFFSKISMKHAVNRLEAFGFKVYMAKIQVSNLKKKIKTCPAA